MGERVSGEGGRVEWWGACVSGEGGGARVEWWGAWTSGGRERWRGSAGERGTEGGGEG